MKRFAAFDFDGSITTKDTLFDFIIYTFGWGGLLRCLFLNTFNLALYALKMRSNEKAKEKMLGSLLKGIDVEHFVTMCAEYSRNRIPQILRSTTMERIAGHREKGDTLIIVSASPENWIKPWATEAGFTLVLATKLEEKKGVLTGKFASRNCYGKEKVNRIAAYITNREEIHLTAYGDSSGDTAMLEYADEGWLLKEGLWTKYNS